MAANHRNNDTRNCDATTIVIGQSSVFINGKLASVKGDINSHGGGELINTTGDTVFVEGKPIIVKGDKAEIDGELHGGDDDAAKGHSPNVYTYGD